MIYFARKRDCEACALKLKCCPNVPARKIARSINEAARDKARAIAKTEAYAVSCRERKKVEMLFAHLKRILRLGRLRLRGPSGAKDEFLCRHSPKSKETGEAHPPPGAGLRHMRQSRPASPRWQPPLKHIARRPKTGFFNEIDVNRTLRIAVVDVAARQTQTTADLCRWFPRSLFRVKPTVREASGRNAWRPRAPRLLPRHRDADSILRRDQVI